MKKVIAFTGLKTSGKTTAYEAVRSVRPDVTEIQLAKKLKDESSKVFDIPRNYFDDQKYKEVPLEDPIYVEAHHVEELIKAYGFEPDFDQHVRQHIGTVLDTPRRVAQYVGTEILRTVDPDIHCKGAVMDLPEEGVFILTDMRFPSELEFFRDKYECEFHPFYIQSFRAEAGVKDMHPSEQQVFVTAKSCTHLPNNDSISDFQKRVISTVSGILNGRDSRVS